LLADDGYPPGALEVLRRFSLDAPIPAAAAARTSAPVLVGTLAERRQRFPRLPNALGDGSVAIACLPLRVADRTFGVLILRYTGERAFGSDERRFLLTLADDCSQALDRARLYAEIERLYEREHHIAETLQASLLPAAFPEAPGLEFAAFFAPTGDGNDVGGDFYDVFAKGHGYTALVGDVCGKGPEAAKLTALCRYTLRTAGMLVDAGPSRTLEFLNRAILEQAPGAQFCTVAVADLTPNPQGAMTATISTGGHPPPLVVRGAGGVEEVALRGGVLGAISEPVLAEAVVELAAGDALVFVTDGVEETRRGDGAFYGHERIRAAFERVQPGATAAALIDALRSDLEEFRRGQVARDDVVILAVRFSGL
jgi:serine phosphatase RsbU (regulator of sigma subunit)